MWHCAPRAAPEDRLLSDVEWAQIAADVMDRTGLSPHGHKRYSTTTPGQVTGYAVALPGDTAKDGGPVWYSGGKVAPDLTWPKLRQRWTGPRSVPGAEQLTAAGQKTIWKHAAQAAAAAAQRIRTQAATDPAAAADAAWAASDTLHVAAAALNSPGLRQAADAFDRAARASYGRIPPPSLAGNELRHAARLIGALAYVTRDPALMPLVLVARLAALAEAVAELRRVQQHAAQADAARTAAQRLHAAAGAVPAAAPAGDPRPRATRRLADTSFPEPFRFVPRKPPPRQRRSGPGSPRPGHGHPHHAHAATACNVHDRKTATGLGQPASALPRRPCGRDRPRPGPSIRCRPMRKRPG